jgi:hypothetical protein
MRYELYAMGVCEKPEVLLEMAIVNQRFETLSRDRDQGSDFIKEVAEEGHNAKNGRRDINAYAYHDL